MPTLPKPAAQRQRRNRISTAATLEAAPAERLELPEGDWHEHTTAWWNTIWNSPMAGEWVDADVPSLFRLAKLDDAFWRSDSAADMTRLAGEIRQQQARFGLTPMDRRSLQWEIARGEEAERKRKVAKPPTEPVADPRKTLRALG